MKRMLKSIAELTAANHMEDNPKSLRSISISIFDVLLDIKWIHKALAANLVLCYDPSHCELFAGWPSTLASHQAMPPLTLNV